MPVSPSMRTVTRVSTTFSSCWSSACIGALWPMISGPPPARLPPRRSCSLPLRNAFSFLRRSSAARRRLTRRAFATASDALCASTTMISRSPLVSTPGFAVVDLDDAEDLLALPERDAEGRADLRAHERLALPDLGRRVGGEDGGALLHDLAEDAARDRDRRARRRVLAAHARHHRDVAGGGARREVLGGLLVVVAEDDGHVRRERHEREARLADRDEHLGEVGRGADLLLRVVERAEAVVVLLDDERLRDEVLDLLQSEDARVVGVVLHGHREVDDAVGGAELDDVTVLERSLAVDRVVDGDALAAPQDGRAVGRALVDEDVALAREDDLRVLARDVRVRHDEVVAFRSADPHDIRGRLERRAGALSASDLEPDHGTRDLSFRAIL